MPAPPPRPSGCARHGPPAPESGRPRSRRRCAPATNHAIRLTSRRGGRRRAGASGSGTRLFSSSQRRPTRLARRTRHPRSPSVVLRKRDGAIDLGGRRVFLQLQQNLLGHLVEDDRRQLSRARARLRAFRIGVNPKVQRSQADAGTAGEHAIGHPAGDQAGSTIGATEEPRAAILPFALAIAGHARGHQALPVADRAREQSASGSLSSLTRPAMARSSSAQKPRNTGPYKALTTRASSSRRAPPGSTMPLLVVTRACPATGGRAAGRDPRPPVQPLSQVAADIAASDTRGIAVAAAERPPRS